MKLQRLKQVSVTDRARTKSWDIYLDGHIGDFPLMNQIENSFFRINNISVTYPHAQLTARTVIKKLWPFLDLGVEIALNHRYVDFTGKMSTAIHGLGKDDTATLNDPEHGITSLSLTLNPLTAKSLNLNFYPLEVVSRWRDPQLQVSENYSDLTKWGSTIFKSCWFNVTFYL